MYMVHKFLFTDFYGLNLSINWGLLSSNYCIFSTMLRLAVALPLLGIAMGQYSTCGEGEGSFYDFEMPLLDGSRNVSFLEYEGKVGFLANSYHALLELDCKII